MLINSRYISWIRCCLFASVITFVTIPANAQEDTSDEELEEIIVTSSRIQKPDFAFSNPVISVDAEAIGFSGATNVGDFLKDLPALTGSLDANDGDGTCHRCRAPRRSTWTRFLST